MFERRVVLLVLLVVSTSPALFQAQTTDILNSGRRVLAAERLADDEHVTLDGILDEPAWRRATSAGEFIMQDPVLGGTPTESTDIRVVFNKDHLYIGVVCYDSEPDKLKGNTRKRDEFLSADDRFMWTIDTFLNQQTGYFFEMNPSGLMADSLMGPGGTNSREWDGIWNARVRRSEVGWTIEIDIPFGTLAFDPNTPAIGTSRSPPASPCRPGRSTPSPVFACLVRRPTSGSCRFNHGSNGATSCRAGGRRRCSVWVCGRGPG